MPLGRLTNAVAMIMLIAAVMFIVPSCQRKPVMAHAAFVHLPTGGWKVGTPLTFRPEYDDSTLTYSLVLAIRHDNSYRYSNLPLVVDLVADDSLVSRHKLDLTLADEYGNWTGGGFGAYFQDTVTIAAVVDPGDAKRVIVWQSIDSCDMLKGLVDIGLITQPLRD